MMLLHLHGSNSLKDELHLLFSMQRSRQTSLLGSCSHALSLFSTTLQCRSGPARAPSDISRSLRTLILGLYDKHLAADGKALDYQALRADPAFRTYVNATAELQKADVTSLSREERIAFFINIYNAIVVHALAVFGPASNLKQR